MIKLKFTIRNFLRLMFLAGAIVKVNAQQQSEYSRYMYNVLSINPAYAGSRDALSAIGSYRAQWVGLDGAPRTGAFSVNSPLQDERLGLGFSVESDKIGPQSKTDLGVDFSYHIPVFETYRLFFGLKASAALLDVDYSRLGIYDPDDPAYQLNNENYFSPNIGAGVYLQSEKAYVGLSVPYMLKTNRYDYSITSVVVEKMHAYLIGGYVFDLSYDLKFKPAAAIKIMEESPLLVDLSANFLYDEKFSMGLSYRWDASVSGMAGFQVQPGLMIGYVYDFDTRKLGNFGSGSHEIFMRFELDKFSKGIGVLTSRFF